MCDFQKLASLYAFLTEKKTEGLALGTADWYVCDLMRTLTDFANDDLSIFTFANLKQDNMNVTTNHNPGRVNCVYPTLYTWLNLTKSVFEIYFVRPSPFLNIHTPPPKLEPISGMSFNN